MWMWTRCRSCDDGDIEEPDVTSRGPNRVFKQHGKILAQKEDREWHRASPARKSPMDAGE